MSVLGPPTALYNGLRDPIDVFVARASGWLRELIDAGNFVELESFWRSPARNAQVGGHPWSQHLAALALDVEVRDKDAAIAAAQRHRLIAVPSAGRSVHAQLLRAGVLETAFRAAGHTTFPVV